MMNPIVRASDWGYWDQLNGVTLTNGETLRVKWPSGKIQVIMITVSNDRVAVSDHGHDCYVDDVRAWYFAGYEGVAVRVPLVGLEAERV